MTHETDLDAPRPYNLYIRPSVKARLQEIADLQDRPMSWVLRRAIDALIERHSRKKVAA
jgi:predicted transcriptional regulator